MKKVLLLGALLSTMAFGGTIVGNTGVSDTIALTGNAIEVLTVTAGTDSIDFGTVVKGSKTEVKTSEITITGDTEQTGVTLTVAINGTSASDVKGYFGSEGTISTAITLEGGSKKETVSFVYQPSSTTDLSATATITAIYTE